MLSPWRGLALLLLTAGLMVLEPWSAHAEAEVDLALVLAVDVSLSMEPDEQDLQRQGFVEAFWTVIERPGDSRAFAARLAESSIQRFGYTSISGAIDFSLWKLRTSGVQAVRQVIDISGDGANNQGRIVTAARDEALAQGSPSTGCRSC